MAALDSTLGAIEIGILLSSCLYGAMAVQAYNYYQANFKNDGIISYRVVELSKFDSKFRWLIILTITVGTVVDIMNTAGLCFCLTSKKKDVARRSRQLTETLMLWSLETGFITRYEPKFRRSTSELNGTMQYVQCDHVDLSVWMCFLVFSAKLYSNSLLASLNGRLTLRHAMATTHITMSTLGTFEARRATRNEVHIDIAPQSVPSMIGGDASMKDMAFDTDIPQ
ncbi:hypothetical protein EW146_g2585 [Bondarzewia mesenterica]|uniref:DUF6534 domain-containing protein n=1 Tax=Bondarzewia mesenterica TaxID=1095465 RepID=A0A4S4M218_9AGAM|nr:hypothetical protein EW146_g2585 [Bondarzewia mesenterica]